MNKVIRNLSIMLLTLSVGIAAYGKPVDETTAKKIGSNFLVKTGVHQVSSVADITTAYIATTTVNGQVITDYYVFNIVGAKGFVMVSADDNIIPILAWSDESSFDIDRINPEAKFWIGTYSKQITAAITNKHTAVQGTSEKWNELKSAAKNGSAKTTVVAPLLGTIAWDQYPGYNNQCPSGSGGRAVTGCVATCMAEIMKFWNWPTIGCGSHTYTPTYLPLPGYGYSAQTADFGNTAYNWAAMPNSGSTAASSSAVQVLMHHAGIGVDMMYGPVSSPSGSGAFVTETSTPFPLSTASIHSINCAEYAMKTYFHYKRTLSGISRIDPNTGLTAITDPVWISTIENELNAGRPVMYSGMGSDGGHCWVCDGWQSGSATFHFNFGWSGMFNGYYSINNVDPGPGGTGGGAGVFNDYQACVIGIRPDSFPSNPGTIQMLSHLDCTTNSPMQYLTPFTVSAKILNAGGGAFSGDFCVQVFDTANKMLGIIQTVTGVTIAAGDSTALLNFASTSGMPGMIPETYFYMRVMYRANSASAWVPVANNNTFINYNAIDVRNSQLFSSNLNLEINSTMAVTPGTTITSGGSLTLNTSISNTGGTDFNGTLKAVLTNVMTGAQFTLQQMAGQTIGATINNPYTFSNTHVAVGSGIYALAVIHQPGGAGATYVTGSDFFENPILITVNGTVGVNPATSVADRVIVYPNPANDMINIDLQGVSTSEILITNIMGRQVQKLTVSNNQSIITVPVSTYAPGIYFVNMKSGDEQITKKVIVR